jgi:hypothetical protein
MFFTVPVLLYYTTRCIPNTEYPVKSMYMYQSGPIHTVYNYNWLSLITEHIGKLNLKPKVYVFSTWVFGLKIQVASKSWVSPSSRRCTPRIV